ncbi:MAG: lysostaphin resistance A-like protein [Brachybacterium alimentarium]
MISPAELRALVTSAEPFLERREFMVEFVLYCVPAAVYLVVQRRRADTSSTLARQRLGAVRGSPSAYGWAALLLAPLLLAAWLMIVAIPDDVLAAPGVSIARPTSVGVALGVVLRAVGEEVLFRGLLGGVCLRRLGFGRGNLLQAAIFLLPHLPLLLIDVRVWPVIPVQFAAGWLLGWLRHRTGSFMPGALVHAVSNLAAGLFAV